MSEKGNNIYNNKITKRRDIDGIKVQRDLYSAFLIQHVNDDLKSINQQECEKDFEMFLELHNKKIERLSKMELSKALKNVV